MLSRRLPRPIRTLAFVLGLTMITMAGAIEQVGRWQQSAQDSQMSQCPGHSLADSVTATLGI